MNIILLAPPAAGKGTQASKITAKYHLKHISTGNLLREAILKKDEMALYLEREMKTGKLISDDIILKLIEGELVDSNYDGVVLDGFPRNLMQALEYEGLLTQLNQKLDCVLYLHIEKEEAKKRIIGRRTCPTCGRIYNSFIEAQAPLKEEVCDVCESILSKRDDDNEETFDLRYETYMKETQPLIEFYTEKGLLRKIDSSKLPDLVFGNIEKVLEGEK